MVRYLSGDYGNLILHTVGLRTTNNRSNITVKFKKKKLTLALRHIGFNYFVFDLIFIIIMLLYNIGLRT